MVRHERTKGITKRSMRKVRGNEQLGGEGLDSCNLTVPGQERTERKRQVHGRDSLFIRIEIRLVDIRSPRVYL